MNQNPYASPEFSGATPTTPPHLAVRGPAIGLLIVQSIWLAILFGSMIMQTVSMAPDILNKLENDPAFGVGQMIGVLLMFAALSLEVLTVYGAYCLLKLEKLPIARTAAIISLIPVCSGCYVLGIPFGIWALIVLSRPEVKAAFR
jgi:hypothetical protein